MLLLELEEAFLHLLLPMNSSSDALCLVALSSLRQLTMRAVKF